jgi:NADP-dependent 3-hydroxy acid dehydrogenase YdfG
MSNTIQTLNTASNLSNMKQAYSNPSYYTNKVVIITGGSAGIGKEIARQILEQGGKVVLTGRNNERLQAVLSEFSIYQKNILLHQGDIANMESNEEMVAKTIICFGKIDVLINNAGLSCFGEVEKMTAETARQIIDTNIYGSLYPVIACLPELKKTKGAVLFISSVAGLHGLPGYSAYSLSKMSLKGLAQSLRAELQNEVFVGISYVGFTENESDKKTMNEKGEWVKVPQRPKLLTFTREKTVSKLLNQIKNRKHSQIQSLLGNFTGIFSRYFPNVLGLILSLNYRNTQPKYSQA